MSGNSEFDYNCQKGRDTGGDMTFIDEVSNNNIIVLGQ